MKLHQSPIGQKDEWITPRHITDALGPFDLDPCAPEHPPWKIADTHWFQDGLDGAWFGNVWCNPPFNRYERPLWMEKCANHGRSMLLILAATETNAFVDFGWNRADAILFLKGRPYFHHVNGERAKGNCGTALCIAGFGFSNAHRLLHSDLGQAFPLFNH